MEIRSTYWRALAGFRRHGAIVVGLIVLSGALESLALASIVPLLYSDQGFTGDTGRLASLIAKLGLSGRGTMYVVLAAFVILSLTSVVVDFLSARRALKLRNDIELSMRRRMTRALLEMNWSSFLSLRLGDINKAVLIEGHETAAGIQTFVYGIGSASVVAVLITLALLLSITLTVVALSFAVVTGFFYRRVGKLAEAQTKIQTDTASMIADQINSIFGSLKFFRSTGIVNRSMSLALSTFKQYAQTYFRSQIYGVAMRAALQTIGIGLICVVLTIAIIREGHLSPESLVFLGVFYRLVPRISVVQDSFFKARAARPWFDAWEERMAIASAHREQHVGTLQPHFEDTLAFEDVSFTFPESTAVVLDHVSWSMRRGECVAIVGESGVGKTTMLDLVSGLLRPSEGNVLLDGTPLSEMETEAWQSRIGLVLQESPLFHGTILQNITWFSDDPDRELASRCAEMAHASSFIENTPMGLDTLVGEKGARLSGGERQRLALARALYRDPWLLILDEATSALDGRSEAIVQQALQTIKGTCSMLIVTHRINTVQLADRIYVLDAGKVAEQGTWAELMASQGSFYEMAARQGLAREPVVAKEQA